jgi:hypothetical protein
VPTGWNYFDNCRLNGGANAEGCRHALSDISRRTPLQTFRFSRQPLVNRSGHRSICWPPTGGLRLCLRGPFGSLSAPKAHSTRHGGADQCPTRVSSERAYEAHMGRRYSTRRGCAPANAAWVVERPSTDWFRAGSLWRCVASTSGQLFTPARDRPEPTPMH